MAKRYRSGTVAAIRGTAEGLRSIGLIDKQTMRTFDEACLTPVRPLTVETVPARQAFRTLAQGGRRPVKG